MRPPPSSHHHDDTAKDPDGMSNTTRQSNRSKSLKFCYGTHVRSAEVENITCADLTELLMFVRQHRAPRKGTLHICAASMKGTRRKDNAQPTRLVGLDYDKLEAGQDMDLVTRLREMRLSAVYWMTHSHTPTNPRMRVMVELDREVTVDEYRAAWRKVSNAIGVGFIPDKSTCHPDQPLFLPGPASLVVRMPGKAFETGELVSISEKPRTNINLEPLPKRLTLADERILRSRNVQAILKQREEYESDSDFDFALFKEIASIVGRNINRVWRIAAKSGAWREKWEREDYVKRTLSAALDATAPPRDVDWSQFDNSLARMQDRPPTPTDWVLPNLLARGATSFIVGRPKGGKSTLALQMGIAACGRDEVWSSWETMGFPPAPRSQNVLYMDLEQSDSLAYQSVARLRLSGKWPSNFWRINSVPRLDEEGLEVMEMMIDRQSMDLVIIDTWLRVDPSDLMEGRNVFSNQGMAVQRVTEIAHRKNIHIAMLVHAGKRTDPSDPSLAVAGTSAMTASVDDIIVVSYPDGATMEDDEETTSRRVLTMMGRNYALSGTRFVVERRDGRLEMLGAEHEVRRNTNHHDVLEALAGGAEMTTAEIAELTGRRRPGVSRTLQQLERSGRVVRVGRRGWRLVEG